jgi:hypothetical protein
MAHTRCLLGRYGYMHERTCTRPGCNTYCFSTATMIREWASVLRYTYIACLVIYIILTNNISLTEYMFNYFIVYISLHLSASTSQIQGDSNTKDNKMYITVNTHHREMCNPCSVCSNSGEGEIFRCHPDRPWAHPDSCTMDTNSISLG